MKPIDLLVYADHSQKLSGKLLSVMMKEKKDKIWKLFLAHSLDLLTITFFTTVLATIFFESVGSVIIVQEVQNLLTDETKRIYVSLLLPPAIFLYFFFSYFLNHGQSYGMFLLKKRLQMNSKSFMESLIWSSHSTLLCLSFGLSYFLKKSKWNQYKEHDYLYNNLVSQKEVSPISLLGKIAEFEKKSTEDKIQWSQAS
jgi:hypothetical protein